MRIAALFGVSHSTISKLKAEFHITDKRGQKRQATKWASQKTTTQEDRFLSAHSQHRNCRQSSTDLQSRFTVRNRLHTSNLRTLRAARRPAIATRRTQHVIIGASATSGNPICRYNARPQRAWFIRDYLQSLGVERIEWPACSPDLNPIEHLWDQLGHALRARVTNTTTLADLRQLLVEEWYAIPQQCVTKLVTSMRRQAVLAVDGSSTCYC
uniref:Tc1-like transposase DDE domain-containing protein n=1 Tax=Mola mola TaxID=94237 RepID=A0A3Q3WSF0_MOLML